MRAPPGPAENEDQCVRRLVYLPGAMPDVEGLASLACAAQESTGAAEAARKAVRLRPNSMIELDPDSTRSSRVPVMHAVDTRAR